MMFEGWASRVHEECPRNIESTCLSRDNLAGRSGVDGNMRVSAASCGLTNSL